MMGGKKQIFSREKSKSIGKQSFYFNKPNGFKQTKI